MATSTFQTSKDALAWFETKVRSVTSMRSTLLKAEESQRGRTVVGKMFFFKYDPKYKAVLPVYDIYPLVFPIEMYGNGFLGLNIHYLSRYEREVFLNLVMKYATATNLTEASRLKITYDIIASSKKLASVSRPCVKRYLYGHVRSKFIEIPATEWDKAAQLPIELFVYKS